MRRNYFIKPQMQLRFVFFLCFVAVVIMAILYFPFEASLTKVLSTMGAEGPEISKSLVPMRISALISVVITIAVLSIVGVYFSHNFAGPLFSLERSLKELKTGNLGVRIGIRKSDELEDLSNFIKDMVSNYRDIIIKDRDRTERICRSVESIIQNTGKNVLNQDQKKELEEIQNQAVQITREFTL